jgi:hypothetical protein
VLEVPLHVLKQPVAVFTVICHEISVFYGAGRGTMPLLPVKLQRHLHLPRRICLRGHQPE